MSPLFPLGSLQANFWLLTYQGRERRHTLSGWREPPVSWRFFEQVVGESSWRRVLMSASQAIVSALWACGVSPYITGALRPWQGYAEPLVLKSHYGASQPVRDRDLEDVGKDKGGSL